MKINTNIRDNYDLYKKLLNKKKVINSTVIILSNEKSSNRNWLLQQELLIHENSSDMSLTTECNKLDIKDYKFAIFAKDLCNDPITRFDSDGAVHTNVDENLTLAERRITTPHFHRYNEEGIYIAYKTDFLKNRDNEEAIKMNLSLGVEHFCKESNVKTNSDECPKISLQQPLNLEINIHGGVNFE